MVTVCAVLSSRATREPVCATGPFTIARDIGDRLVRRRWHPYGPGMWHDRSIAAHHMRNRPAGLARRRLLMSGLALPLAGFAQPAGAGTVTLDAALRRALAGLPLLRGEPVRPDDLTDRVVVVNFFASWCPPCRPEMTHLNRLVAESDADRLRVIGINLFEDFGGRTGDAALDRFLDQMQPAFPILRGDDAVAEAFDGVDRIPTLFVFEGSGRMARHFVHQRGSAKTHLDLEELRAAVVPLLAG